MKQTIETKLGVIIILIFAMTVGVFVWKWEKNQPGIEQVQTGNIVFKSKTDSSKQQQKNEITQNEKEKQNEVNQKNTEGVLNETISYKSNQSTPVLSTEDWNFHAVKKNLIDKPLFELEYPADWSLDGSVFSSNGNKIAEIIPAGIIMLKNDQHCFDTDFKTEYPDLIKLVSKNKFKIGDNEGILRITKVPITSTIWFPNSYCIEKNGKALVLTFYEKDLNSPNKKIFENIVSTVNFGN